MLKFLFCCLLVLNLLLFALGRGYLGSLGGEMHEPARLNNQLNADKLSVIAATRAAAAATDSATAVASGARAPAPPPVPVNIACTEIGNFPPAEARRFETQLEALKLGDRQSRHNAAGQEISSYIVFIPPQGSKEGADRKAAELKQLGVENYFIIPDSPLRWGISLGVFKTEPAAQSLLASLVKQGVHTARVNPRYTASKAFAYQLRDLDAATKQRLDQIKAGFADQEMRSCK